MVCLNVIPIYAILQYVIMEKGYRNMSIVSQRDTKKPLISA